MERRASFDAPSACTGHSLRAGPSDKGILPRHGPTCTDLCCDLGKAENCLPASLRPDYMYGGHFKLVVRAQLDAHAFVLGGPARGGGEPYRIEPDWSGFQGRLG